MSEKACFVLDPTTIYPAPTGWRVINSEAQWLRETKLHKGQFWIQGKFLCNWTHQWLKDWEMEEAIAETKELPQIELCRMLSLESLPPELNEWESLNLVSKLAALPADNKRVARFLAQETGYESVWLGSPSLTHLAEWLMVEVAKPYKFIEQIWQGFVANESEGHLRDFYLTKDKPVLLRQWVGLDGLASIRLGRFPLSIPSVLAKEFDDLWTARIIKSEGRILDSLRPYEQPGMDRIGEVARKVFLDNPSWLSHTRLNVLSGYLAESARQELIGKIPPPMPEPLASDATVDDALHWATEQYLPYRNWEVRYGRNRDESLRLSVSEIFCKRRDVRLTVVPAPPTVSDLQTKWQTVAKRLSSF